MRIKEFFGLSGAVLALSCSHPSPKAPRVSTHRWSDAELLHYALVARQDAYSSSRASSVAPRSAVLGQHNGLTLVQTVSYNDVCCTEPTDFSIVVHYELAKGTDCASVAGVSKSLRVPNGYSSSVRRYCFPKILVDHWPEVAPKMTPE